MTGKEYRMGRLAHPQDGRSVVLPVDNGVALGHVDGLRDPVSHGVACLGRSWAGRGKSCWLGMVRCTNACKVQSWWPSS